MTTYFRTADNNFATAKWIVNKTAGLGTHTTIAGAVASASDGDTIFIMPGTYVENITIPTNLNLTANLGDAACGTELPIFLVSILGTITMSANALCNISNIGLQTNASYLVNITGTHNTNVILNNCYLFVDGYVALGISSSGTSAITLNQCYGNLYGGTDSFFATTSGTIQMNYCTMVNQNNSTTANTLAGSNFNAFATYMNSPVTTSGASAITTRHSYFGQGNTTSFTLAGTSTLESTFCEIHGGTASAVNIGAGCTANLYGDIVVSSNTNAITGSGTVNYGAVTFSGSSSTINTTTKSPKAWAVFQGGTGLTATTANQLLYSSSNNVIAGLTSGNSLLAATDSSGTLAMRAFSIVTKVFTGNGTYTYTPTAGMLYCIAEVIGSGGGGAGAPATGATTVSAGGGGGGGGYARKTISKSTLGASQTITIGAGGGGGVGNSAGSAGNTSSVGSIVTASGGSGGGNAGAASVTTVAGGIGGTGGSGDVDIYGQVGGSSFGIYLAGNSAISSGFGGGTILGGGGQPVAGTATSNNGNNGQNYGSGGSGGANTASQASAVNGGNGADGLVIITEFVIA